MEAKVHFDNITGNSKGFAFVTYQKIEDATAVYSRQSQGNPHR